MIFYLRGVVSELTPAYAVMDVGGVGYYVGISVQTSQKLHLGKESTIYTQQIIREDAHLLFGFFDKEEREMFNLLISVNGVGAVSAMILLSSLELSNIVQAILSGNSGILIDLRDKVQKFDGLEAGSTAILDNKIREEALSALEVLGIPRKTSEKIADKILKQNPEASVEELVKQVLKNI